MKSLLCAGFTLLALAPVVTLAAGMDVGRMVDTRVNWLDQLVQLTATQKAQAAVVFKTEIDALQAFTSLDDRMIKGTPIRQNSRAQIRTLLTPAQQRIYDASPQRLGGGSMNDPARLAERVDKVVTLTDAQTLQVAAIFQHETDALQALSPADRPSQGAPIRQASKAQIRALLTPEQQQKFDANPNGAEDLAEKAFVTAFIKSAPAVVAHFGTITRMIPGDSSLNFVDVNGAGSSLKGGTYTFAVQGSTTSGTITVYWEKPAPTEPIKIGRVEGPGGATIQP